MTINAHMHNSKRDTSTRQVIYQQEYVLKDFKEMMQPWNVFHIFASMKKVEKLLDVGLCLDGDGQLLTPDRWGQARAKKRLIRLIWSGLESEIFDHIN